MSRQLGPPGRLPLRSWLTLLAAGLVCALTLAFLALRLALPADGARLDPTQPLVETDGVRVYPLIPMPHGLQPGDRVVAMAGRATPQWAARLFGLQPAPGELTRGAVLEYQVRAGGTRRTVQVRLGAFPMAPVVRSNWGFLAFCLGSLLITAFVFARRPAQPAARALLMWGSGVFSAAAWTVGLQAVDLLRPALFWLHELATGTGFLLIWAAGVHFTLVFPRPLPSVIRRPQVIAGVYLLPYLLSLADLATAERRGVPHLQAALGERWGDLTAAGLWGLLALAILVLRYRRESEVSARQQMRWLVWAGSIAIGTELVTGVIPELLDVGRPVSTNVIGLVGLLVPASLAISILRHRLLDIDVVINRTLVYGSLTVSLAAVYLLGVITLQTVFRALTGAQSDLAIVLSTLVIAALFRPLRAGIQGQVDRRFYRRKYDSALALGAFAGYLRHQVELEEIRDLILETLTETVQPEHAWLWLRPAGYIHARDMRPMRRPRYDPRNA